LDENSVLAKKVPVAEWIVKPGLPENAPRPTSSAFAQVEKQAQLWLSHQITVAKIPTAKWTTQEWLHFLKTVQDAFEPPAAGSEGASPASRTELSQTERVKLMGELDRAFKLTRAGNSEIEFQWLLMSIRNHYEPANPRLEEFLLTIGRRKFIKPLYEELAKTPEGKKRAMAIYRRARPTYHPIAVASIDDVLKWSEESSKQ
jgi:leukotriene-A4 hydrolase